MIVLKRMDMDGDIEIRSVTGMVIGIPFGETEAPHTVLSDDRGYLAVPPFGGSIIIEEDGK